jgi:hypothetical protein
MDQFVYYGFVIAGAATLVVEAYRNFNSVSARHPFELHPILKEVEVRNLCTSGEVIFGFACYVVFYLITYAVLLTSAEVYGLLLRAQSAALTVGATDTGVNLGDPSFDNTFVLADDQYNKPIVVSALIIASLSLGAVKPIENTMRSLAHRLSGVPRGVYKVIDDLLSVDYEKLMQSQPRPLTDAFDVSCRKQPAPIVGAENNPERTTPAAKNKIDQSWGKEMKSHLVAVDCLREATNPGSRGLYFPLYDLERLRPLSEKIDEQYNKLKDDIDGLSPETAAEKKLEMVTSAMIMRNNLMAYFSVLFIRNNRALYNTQPHASDIEKKPVVAIKEHLLMPSKDEHNAFGIALLASFVLAFVLSLLIYYFWQVREATLNPQLYALLLDNLESAGMAIPECAAPPCADVIRAGIWQRMPLIIDTVTWDQLQMLAVTCFAVIFVIIGRDTRLEQQSWPEWNTYQFPFLRFLSLSLLSGLSAAFLTALIGALKLWWAADFSITNSQIINLFSGSGGFFLLQIGAGIILAMTALAIMDKHNDTSWHMLKTLTAAATGGFLYLVYQWFCLFLWVQPVLSSEAALKTTRDAIILSAMPLFFLVLFAMLLELTEKAARRERQAADARMRDEPASAGAT